RPRHPRHPRLALRAAAAAATATGTTTAGASGAARARGLLRLLDLRQELTVGADQAHAHVGDVRRVPRALLTRHAAEVHGAVGQFRRRLGGTGLPSTSAATLRRWRAAFLRRHGLARLRHPDGAKEHEYRGRAHERGTNAVSQGKYLRKRADRKVRPYLP